MRYDIPNLRGKMSEFTENPVEVTATPTIKKAFNKKKAIIASVVAGALIIVGAVGVTAFKSRPDVRLVTALSNLFKCLQSS